MIPKREDLVAEHYVPYRRIAQLLRELYRLGASGGWVSISNIDMHPSKLAFLLYYLQSKRIVALKTATRGRTVKIGDFVQLPPSYDAVSEVRFLPDYREKIDKLHLLG